MKTVLISSTDSSPKYFEIILNFLRRGVMENVANVDLKFLRNEAEYFCIQGLVKVVDEEIEKTEKREALRVEQLKRIDKNVTKIGSNEALRLQQMKRIDENVTKIEPTVGQSQGAKFIRVGRIN